MSFSSCLLRKKTLKTKTIFLFLFEGAVENMFDFKVSFWNGNT